MLRIVRAMVPGLTLLACACGAEEPVIHAEPVASADVQVRPKETRIHGDQLRVTLLVQNTSSRPLVLQRDQMLVHLPSGQTLTRALGLPYGEGIWGSYYGAGGWVTQEPFVIAPGAVRPVEVAFTRAGFDWKNVPRAQIDFDGAITRDGQVVLVPPLLVTRFAKAVVVGGTTDVSVRPVGSPTRQAPP